MRGSKLLYDADDDEFGKGEGQEKRENVHFACACKTANMNTSQWQRILGIELMILLLLQRFS